MLSHVFAFGDNISLDTWLKTITFVASGNCYVCLRKNCLLVSAVLEGETRDRNGIFEHIDVSLLSGSTHFFYVFQERHHIQVIVPGDKFFNCDHLVFLPHLLAVSVLFFWDVLIFESRVERSVRGQRCLFELIQPVYPLIRKEPFGLFAFVGFQIVKCPEMLRSLSWGTYDYCFLSQWTW